MAMGHCDMMDAVGAAAKIGWLRRGKSSPTTLRLHRPRSETNTKKIRAHRTALPTEPWHTSSEQRAPSIFSVTAFFGRLFFPPFPSELPTLSDFVEVKGGCDVARTNRSSHLAALSRILSCSPSATTTTTTIIAAAHHPLAEMAKGTSAIDPSNYASLGLTHVQCRSSPSSHSLHVARH